MKRLVHFFNDHFSKIVKFFFFEKLHKQLLTICVLSVSKSTHHQHQNQQNLPKCHNGHVKATVASDLCLVSCLNGKILTETSKNLPLHMPLFELLLTFEILLNSTPSVRKLA